MQVYLAVTPGQLQEAARHCRNLAHVAYRIGRGLHAPAPERAAADPGRAAGRHRPGRALDRRARKSCLPQCSGSADAGASPARCWTFRVRTADRLAFAKKLASALTQTRRTLYMPEAYGPAVPGAIPLICTALSGGDFAQRLREAALAAGGAGRLALDVQRLRMDFTLPARTGEGVPLSRPGVSGADGTGIRRRCSSPRSCAPGTSPTPGRGRPTLSSLTTPEPSGKSSGPVLRWASPPLF